MVNQTKKELILSTSILRIRDHYFNVTGWNWAQSPEISVLKTKMHPAWINMDKTLDSFVNDLTDAFSIGKLGISMKFELKREWWISISITGTF